jgi:predicted phosphodiesterase
VCTGGGVVRVGLLSDVHGNLAGLQAVAGALQTEGGLEHVVVAGDLLQGGPRPREVWDLLRRLGWLLVRGNEDDALLDREFAARQAVDAGGAAMRHLGTYLRQHDWSRAVLDAGDQGIVRGLAALPARLRLPTPAGDLLVVHSSPRSITDRHGAPGNSAAEVAASYGGSGASAIAFGHWHQNFVRPAPFGLLINVASVGLPLDGRPLAGYTVLTGTAHGWIVEQRRVPYDPAEEAAAAAAAGMPPWVE